MGEGSAGKVLAPPRLEKQCLGSPDAAAATDLKRVPRLITSAMIWSMVLESNCEALVGAMPVAMAALPDQCWKLGLSSTITRIPLNTFILLLKGSSGLSWTVVS